ncbi:putative mucoidy inhibitor A [Lyophyllum shimeji]|uniref:Mucoidy inhibitor A n=1 Tax=Lyophyllum shimeji TaxID=47721 RepID=A0A9P3Q0D3_LYOSH|nr:putative mucoidy inhibitor A [Lyophyllum shimeji]
MTAKDLDNAVAPADGQQSVNSVDLVAALHSKITGVGVYKGRAEITRVFRFNVKAGQNQVTIDGLPDVLDEDSIRVEGHGAATIHDVTITRFPRPVDATTSNVLSELCAKRERITKALERTKKALAALDTFLNSFRVEHIGAAQIASVVKGYETTAEELDNRVLTLENEQKEIEKDMEKEQSVLWGGKGDDKLNKRVVIGVFADAPGEVEIALIYAVHGGTWTPGYDIRVDMQAKEEQVLLVYKASITQNTGEDWTDVPLTLETAKPIFGEGVPTLNPWKLSLRKAPAARSPVANRKSSGAESFLRCKAAANTAEVEELEPMEHRGLDVVSKGHVNATFQVPGLISIPSDGVSHNVTIVQLHLGAKLSWVCVPKKDPRVYLNARIKNTSEYTLLRGPGSVYVDGSFISRTKVPFVSPGESFDCSLGPDPSIRVWYLPRTRTVSQSGFYTKTATTAFTQNITVQNTKPVRAEGVRVVEQVPVSEDAQVQVSLITPPFIRSEGNGIRNRGGEGNGVEGRLVQVAPGVMAMWEGAEEPQADLGRNGMLCWVCDISAQGKVELVLQWEVAAPAREEVVGLA